MQSKHFTRKYMRNINRKMQKINCNNNYMPLNFRAKIYNMQNKEKKWNANLEKKYHIFIRNVIYHCILNVSMNTFFIIFTIKNLNINKINRIFKNKMNFKCY